mgnify:CR=1 FL=1
MKCCFTGHRYFPWSSDLESSEYQVLIERLDRAIDQVLAKAAIHFICGNAIGVEHGPPSESCREKLIIQKYF